nr:uncharacterized protein LOC109774199 [Aegilops tauschii subsp. strangulata]
MSDQSDSQNKTRRKRNSDSDDEDYVAVEEEVTSKKVLKKEYAAAAAATKPGLHKKAPAKRVPMSKARASTLEVSKSTEEEAVGGKKKKERKRGSWCKCVDPIAEFEKHSSDEEEEDEEDAAPKPKNQKLMGNAIRSGAAPSKPKTTSKATAQASKSAPKRSTRNIPAAEKNKAPVPEVEEEEAQVLRKLKPKIPDHDDSHPVAENMKERKDADGRIVWMTKGTRYQSTVAEWAKLINAPEEAQDDIDVYARCKKYHNSMANMYKEIPDKALETHKLG